MNFPVLSQPPPGPPEWGTDITMCHGSDARCCIVGPKQAFPFASPFSEGNRFVRVCPSIFCVLVSVYPVHPCMAHLSHLTFRGVSHTWRTLPRRREGRMCATCTRVNMVRVHSSCCQGTVDPLLRPGGRDECDDEL